MLSDLSCLLWLQRRHLRSELNFYLWAAGADLDDQKDMVERLYLLYVAALLAAAAVAGWLWLLGLVEGAVAPAGQPAELRAISAELGRLAAAAALAVPVLCGAVWCVRAAWTPRLQLSAPDRAVLAQLPVRPGLWALVSMVPQLAAAGAAGAVAGYLLADAAVLAAGSSPGPAACLPYAAALGLGLAAARGASWLVSMARLRLGRAARVPLALGVAAVSVAAGLLALTCLPLALAAAQALLSPLPWVPLAAALVAAVALAAGTVAAARGLTACALTAEAAADADLYAVRRMAFYNPQLYRELVRRSRAARRRPLGRMPRWRGAGAPLARAVVSAVRRYDALPRILAAGALLAPCGVLLLSGNALAQASQAAGLLGGAAGGRFLGRRPGRWWRCAARTCRGSSPASTATIPPTAWCARTCPSRPPRCSRWTPCRRLRWRPWHPARSRSAWDRARRPGSWYAPWRSTWFSPAAARWTPSRAGAARSAYPARRD